MKARTLLAMLALLLSGRAQRPGLGEVPFVLTWVEGRCVNCEFARSVGHIQFTNDNEVWGIGDGSREREGLGEHIVVHSSDGGRTWRELPGTHMHAVSPTVKFLDATTGWIFYWPTPYPYGRLIRTDDGGNNWQTVRGEFDYPTIIDGNHWYETGAGKFLRTDDAGLRWSETPIPHLGHADRTFFLSPDTGWIASTDGDDFLVFRTTDGGITWQESRTRAPAQIADVRVLFFLDRLRGWLVTFHSLYEGSNLFATADGGKTWVQERDQSFQGKGRWTSVLCFLSERMGFAFGSELKIEKLTDSGQDPPVISQARYSLTYTDDGGAHWHKRPLASAVYDCQIFRGDLQCSAGSPYGFKVLRVHRR